MLVFRYIRFLTAFKVLRVIRIFYEINFLHFLFSIISRSLSSFIYLALLFLLLNFVYALVGMQLFGGLLNVRLSSYNTFNFDTFWVAFITVFDIVTLDNWITVLSLLYNSEKTPIITNFYVISWIFLGNFALLNLFLAILLDGFTQSLEEEDKIKIIDEEHKELENEELLENIIGNQELQIIIPKDAREAFVDELTKEYLKYTKIMPGNDNKDAQLLEDLITETQKSNQLALENKGLSEIRCENSFFLFSKDHPMRIVFFKVLQNKYYKLFMVMLLFFSCFIILLETYFDKNSEEIIEKTYVLLIKITNALLTFLFLFEIAMKSVVYGFCLNKHSFMRSFLNILDACIVFSYIVDFIFFEEDFALNISSVYYNIFVLFKLKIFKIIRSIRILRPLRFIAISKGLRLVVNALKESISSILNVTFLLISLWTAYGILGIILYRDRFGYCGDRLNFGVGIAKVI